MNDWQTMDTNVIPASWLVPSGGDGSDSEVNCLVVTIAVSVPQMEWGCIVGKQTKLLCRSKCRWNQTSLHYYTSLTGHRFAE